MGGGGARATAQRPPHECPHHPPTGTTPLLSNWGSGVGAEVALAGRPSHTHQKTF